MSPFQKVAAYARPGTAAFGLGVVGEIFADRSARGLPAFSLSVCTDEPGSIPTNIGLSMDVDSGLDRLAAADLVILLPTDNYGTEPSPEVLDAVHAAYDRGATVAAYCVGSYLLAATGLLNGLRATTHWRYAAEFAHRFPEVKLQEDALYVDEGRILTGAGAAAGIDLCLHLLRREYGAHAANEIARTLVVAPHREGDQAQFVSAPLPQREADRFSSVILWARENLHQSIKIDELASRALMSPRTFARRFQEAMGASPHAWLVNLRLSRAEELLETTDLPVEEVARQVGYTSAAALRHQFMQRRGVPPRSYRRAFSRRAPAEDSGPPGPLSANRAPPHRPGDPRVMTIRRSRCAPPPYGSRRAPSWPLPRCRR
ncbi:GlxA family transcriptional regulator [Streptomyces purpureus]|uniref:AraC family transcriptional regulator n=1 Tax=Streptomyces purpureus TaxID=1951 RepID=A0A918GWP9_9ACTN|nr:helix-turn-helix domain-containing protein [Streptomyces purpureus]GGT12531.1 AraC family transcriptional regulator [Streptomyces purpureus]